MPRPRKCRRIGFAPSNLKFEPQEPSQAEVVLLEEELESIRLSDLERMDQSDAAAAMGISRGTYQRILGTARLKVADALLNGHRICFTVSSPCERGLQQGFRGCGRCTRCCRE